MTAGDQDVGLIVTVNAPVGSACVLYANPGYPGEAPAVEFGSMALSSDGTTATYTTTGEDFTIGGNWTIQVEVTPPSAGPIRTAPSVFFVNTNIGG